MKSLMKWLLIPTVLILTQCGSEGLSSWVISKEQEYEMGVEFDRVTRDSLKIKKITVYDAESYKTDKTSKYAKWWVYIDSLRIEMQKQQGLNEYWDGLIPTTPTGVNKSNFFKVALIDQPTINAFAVPGGFFYIYTGILKDFKSESELIAVMGHEIGHILKHHSRQSMAQSAALGGAASILLGDQASTGAQILTALGTNYFLMENSREHELESDEIGVKFSEWLGINPYGISDYFGKGIVDPVTGICNDGSSSVLGQVSEAFSTHPPHCDRVTQVKTLVSKDSKLQSLGQQPKSSKRYLELKNL